MYKKKVYFGLKLEVVPIQVLAPKSIRLGSLDPNGMIRPCQSGDHLGLTSDYNSAGCAEERPWEPGWWPADRHAGGGHSGGHHFQPHFG